MNTEAKPMYEWKEEPTGLLSSSQSEFTKPLPFERHFLTRSQSEEEPDEGKVCAVTRTDLITSSTGQCSGQGH